MSDAGWVLLGLIAAAWFLLEPQGGSRYAVAVAAVFTAAMLVVVYQVYDVGAWAPPFGS